MLRHENIYNLQVRIIKYLVYTHDRGLSFGFGLNVSIISDDFVKINLNMDGESFLRKLKKNSKGLDQENFQLFEYISN